MAIKLKVVGNISYETHGTFLHDELMHRDLNNQHPISSITGLESELSYLLQLIRQRKEIFFCDSLEELVNNPIPKDYVALVKDKDKHIFYVFDDDCWKPVNKQKDFDISEYISDKDYNIIKLDADGKIFGNPIVVGSQSTQVTFYDIETMDTIRIPKTNDIFYSSLGIHKIWKKVPYIQGNIYQAVSPLNYVEQQTEDEIIIIWKDESTDEIKVNFETNITTPNMYTPRIIFKEFNGISHGSMLLVADIREIFDNSGFTSIWNTEVIIENIDAVEPSVTSEMIIVDGTTTILSAKLKCGEVQKYNLGISINNKILVKGNFNIKIYIQGL